MKKSDTRKISEMRNLGPACESDLNSAGIFTAQEVIQFGAEETFLRMLIGRKKAGLSTKNRCNAAYLYAIYGAIHDVAWGKVPEDMKERFKAFAQELRDSGRFR